MLKNNCSKKVNDSKEFTIFGFLRRPSSRQNYTFFRLLGLATEPRSSSTGLFLFPNPKKWPHTFCKHLLLSPIRITSKFRLATKGKFFSVPSLAIPTLNLLRTNGLNWYTLLKLSQKKDSRLSTTEAADPDHSQSRIQGLWRGISILPKQVLNEVPGCNIFRSQPNSIGLDSLKQVVI